MPTFTPPTVDEVIYFDPYHPRRGDIFSRIGPTPRGVTVYKLTDNTYTQSHPSDQTTIAITYHGGHEHIVSAAEETALINAGYSANIT